MKILDENMLAEAADDTETPHQLAEEDKDFLKSLEKMAEEVEEESKKPK